ncbi:MAG: glycerol-3-phosphate dehydrogenase [Rhodospirillales bacterium 20-60-12]|nr:MAG: glycerol-3-phosphate dehydrogenase [Rhodospirillales bacterium 20-60-12]HQT68286.1 NAD(P)H-dependent glycerol-3-phosphate dehydrogenase [Acetobacteraceae bacterium]
MSDLAIIGAGAWGTALAVMQARAGRHVTLWGRNREAVSAMASSRLNPRLPGIALGAAITCTADLPAADISILVVPMQHLRAVLTQLPRGDGPLVLACKGIEAGSLRLPGEVAAATHPGRPCAVLTGPNFAHEIAAGLPAAAVLAMADPIFGRHVMERLAAPYFRLYGSTDPLGAAIGGAAKNVIAIAAGMVSGAGLGENARAALITRGVAEIGRLAAALGGKAETISGLAGLGDLLLTCTGAASRNFSLGYALGRGDALADILAARNGVTEGVSTAPALLARAAQRGVDMPITQAVVELLAGRTDIAQTTAQLLARDMRDE